MFVFVFSWFGQHQALTENLTASELNDKEEPDNLEMFANLIFYVHSLYSAINKKIHALIKAQSRYRGGSWDDKMCSMLSRMGGQLNVILYSHVNKNDCFSMQSCIICCYSISCCDKWTFPKLVSSISITSVSKQQPHQNRSVLCWITHCYVGKIRVYKTLGSLWRQSRKILL